MNFTPLDSSRQRASFEIKIFAKFAMTREIQRCKIHRSKSLIKQPTAMNFTPLDSPRQRASFEIKIFAKFAKKVFF
jgi:hypothetical protein